MILLIKTLKKVGVLVGKTPTGGLNGLHKK
jgi:hypothetical protein